MTEGEKKRASYFTEAELGVLLCAYEEFKPIFAKKSNTAASHKERALAWQKITNKVNACKSGAKRTPYQVKMKYKNMQQKANRKKARLKRLLIDDIPGDISPLSTSNDTISGGSIILLEPPEIPESISIDEDEDTILDNAGMPTENLPGDLKTTETHSASTSNLCSLSAKELHKVHLQRQIRKSEMEMDLMQLEMEKKKMAIQKAKLEVEILEYQLKEMKK
ncbi:hypothetical protein OJAV_G00130170 [Oryzias javanicus]|uniref:Myb/SANT-like DNA-binding domain-containing protein n=1 Tax=Oryzias javanicus TaxID=123683 RepID=A0A3S2MD98_ORYJA|nr:hypothetical protein OJAV_G00130170 [Oryzias javanicus]